MTDKQIVLILDLIDLALVAATSGPAAVEGYNAHMAKVRQMIAEGRDPTEEEANSLKADIDTLRASLHG